jgi:glutamyl-tRNA synthetase
LSLRDLRAEGIEPFAILSLMARLGSSDPVALRTTIDELIEGFDLSHYGSAPTKFDMADLLPLTARYNQMLPYSDVAADIAALGVPAEIAAKFWELVHENITFRGDMAAWWTLLRDGAKPLVADEDKEFVAEAFALLPDLPYDGETWGNWTAAVKEKTGRKGRGLFMPLRHAVTGLERGPEMADMMALLQKVPSL